MLARFIRAGQARWLYGAAFSSGLTVLAKETAVLLVPVVVVFLLLVPEIRIRFRHQITAVFLFVIAVAPYPAAIFIGKGTGAAGSFAAWEILRQPNHTWTFYGDILPAAVGPLTFIIALVGLLYVLRRGSWEDRLLTSWIAIPAAFFELWPVKGFQYLMPIAPAIAILVGLMFDRGFAVAMGTDRADAWEDAAGRTTKEQIKDRRRIRLPGRLARLATTPSGQTRFPRPLATGLTSVLLAMTILGVAIPTAQAVASTSISGSLAGTGGLPGGREVGPGSRTTCPPERRS